jgi:transcriptional regulator with XRE-family HTH domain
MTLIRLSGSQLHAARVLAGLSLDDLAERARLCRHSIRKWETSSHAIPGAMYPHLCRLIDALENEGVRFSGDGLPAARLINSEGVHVANGPRCSASVTPAYEPREYEQESQSARVLQWFAARLPSNEHFHSFSGR